MQREDDVKKREERVKQRIEFHRERINGPDLSEERSRVWDQESRRAWRECQAYRQAAMRKYGITDQSSIDGTQIRDLFVRERQQSPVNTSQHAPSTHHTDNSHIPRAELTPSQLEKARMIQIQQEHFRLSSGPQPVDPFAPSNAGLDTSASNATNRTVLLNRIQSRPQLIEYYPYAKQYLEETPDISNDELRVSAKTSVELQDEPENLLPQEIQEVHERISSTDSFSNRAERIILMTTFIPPGSYTTYAAIREWSADVGDKCPDSHICGTLKKAFATFDLDEVPVHRIVRSNMGVCDWGDHMLEVDEDMRFGLHEEEGIRFDKNGRILGGRL
jgi:alkylated DNA nucleotide flippase Atl1